MLPNVLIQKRQRDKEKVKIKIKRRDPKFLNSIQVPTTNRFSALDNNGMDIEQTPKVKKVNISPIVITDFVTDIQKILTDAKVDCNIKIISVGRKIFPKSTEDKTKIIDALQKVDKLCYFTHPENNAKTFKVILSGLPQIDTKIIEESINSQIKVQPTKIVMFESKSTNKLYLLHFNAEQINLKTLEPIQYIYHHVIKWLPYKPKRNGPTQCYRCLMFGHGITQCRRYAACMLCAGDHITSVCLTHHKTNVTTFKCFNCASAKIPDNHKANDVNCPFRQKYEEARNNARNKTKTYQRGQVNTANTTKETMSSNTRLTFAEQLKQATAATSRRQSNISAASNQFQTQSNTRKQSTSTHVYDPNDNVGKNVWSIAECTNIMFNSIEKLQNCKSKLEQLRVITELLQHACT